MDIFISSLAFLGHTIDEIGTIALENDLSIEFSSGIAPDQDAVSKIQLFGFPKYIHNYFPAPFEPFVLNLASNNPEIRNRSIRHTIQGIDISRSIGAKFFSVHAGFCLDPDFSRLGKPLGVTNNFDRNLHWALFLNSLKEVLEYAEKQQIQLLIENNVLSKFNYIDGANPLLCCDKADIIRLYNEVSSPYFGFLLDTAHWKVSANTLGFELHDGLKDVLSKVQCIHHSDNDGLIDSNDILDQHEYWFSEYIPTLEKNIHVLEIKNLSPNQIDQQMKILKSFLR
jgi:hypothetical protein